MEEKDCIKLQNISNEFILNRTKNLNKYSITNDKFNNLLCNSKKKESLEYILNLSHSILEKSNIKNYSKDIFIIEFQKRNSGFELNEEKYNHFAWHKDDYGIISHNVYTVIFYIRKDITIKGGNLLYKLQKKSDIMKKDIIERDILCFKGDIQHIPENVEEFGCRDIIVIFFKRL